MICNAQMPLTMPNFITMYEKSVTFFTPFSILAPQGDLLCQSSPVWVVTYSKAPSIKLPNFVPFSKYEIAAVKVRRFRGRHNTHTHTNSKVNDTVSAYHAVTKELSCDS